MKRICYLATWDSVHTHRWLSYFSEKGYEIHLISNYPKKCPELENIKLYNLAYRGEERIRRGCYSLYFLIRRWRLALLLKKIKPHILHSHALPFWGWWGANANFHPFVITVWGQDTPPDTREPEQIKKEMIYALKKADLITSDSEDLRRWSINLGASPENNYIVHWGVDFNDFNMTVNGSVIRKELNLHDDPVVISVRQFRELYNIDIIVKAFSQVLKEIPEAKLILKNYQGEEFNKIYNLVEKLRIKDAVRFVGKVDYKEMAKYYRSSDVFVSVPSCDSTSISMLEAMACGVVPVVSDLPASKEWIKDGENGFIVPVRNVEALADAIVKVLKNKKENNNLIREYNFNLVKSKADYYRHMENMERLYKKLSKT